jgi:hypothetical protein
MELEYTIRIIYKDEDGEMAGESTPDPEDISEWIIIGMAKDGCVSADRVEVTQP